MITLTAGAAKRIKGIMVEENKETWGLRIGASGGGCSGLTYQLDFAEKEGDEDEVFDPGLGIKVFVDKVSMPFLDGTEIDYVETALGGAFAFKNPNSTGSCGCNKSFSV